MGLFCLTAAVAGWAGGMSPQPFAAANDSTAKKEAPIPEECIVDEVIWVVGNEPILKSDVEMMRLQGQSEGMTWNGDPDCLIPEQLAVQKLFLHQAALDSIEVSESEIAAGVEKQIDYWVQLMGSREKLEEYRNQTITEMRQSMHDEYKNTLLIQKMREKLVEDIKVTPADVEGFAKRVAKAQFAQYGMLSIPEDVLNNYAKEMLKNAQTAENIANRAVEEQLAAWLKEQVTLDEKEVSADEFAKLFE